MTFTSNDFTHFSLNIKTKKTKKIKITWLPIIHFILHYFVMPQLHQPTQKINFIHAYIYESLTDVWSW